MHSGDPLMDVVRLDTFSMHGDATKMDGLFSGYGVSVPGQQPGQWPPVWRSRLPLYRIALALELYNWFTISGQPPALPAIQRELRELLGDAPPSRPRLADPGPQVSPGLLGGLGCLGGAEHDRVDVGQAVADVQGDVNSGLGCRSGQAFGIAEQQIGGGCLD